MDLTRYDLHRTELSLLYHYYDLISSFKIPPPWQVPSILIAEYQSKLSEGRIGNTYLGGDLSLVSLTKISLLGLKMLLRELDSNRKSSTLY